MASEAAQSLPVSHGPCMWFLGADTLHLYIRVEAWGLCCMQGGAGDPGRCSGTSGVSPGILDTGEVLQTL